MPIPAHCLPRTRRGHDPLRWRRAVAAGLAGLILAAPAAAFDIPPPPPPPYDMLILPLFPNGTTVPFSGQSGGAGRHRAAPQAASTLASGRPQVDASARELAQAMPPAYRQQMVGVYRQSFDTWRQLERKLDLPANDVAGAVAAFIAGNYMAYRNVTVPDAAYHRLVAQLRSALRDNAGFARTNTAQRRQLYEQMAMVGTFMAVAQLSLQQRPDPQAEQHFRNAAAANLEMALKVPAARIRLTEQGLQLD